MGVSLHSLMLAVPLRVVGGGVGARVSTSIKLARSRLRPNFSQICCHSIKFAHFHHNHSIITSWNGNLSCKDPGETNDGQASPGPPMLHVPSPPPPHTHHTTLRRDINLHAGPEAWFDVTNYHSVFDFNVSSSYYSSSRETSSFQDFLVAPSTLKHPPSYIYQSISTSDPR